MKRKNKKIVAGMMAGFCVLSTQSVLGNFSKLPMRGGNGLISYAMVDDDNGLLVGNGGIATKNSSNLQAFGASDKNAFEETNEVEKKLDASEEENEDKAQYEDGKTLIKDSEDKKRNIKRQGLPINGHHVHIRDTHFYIPDIKKQKLNGSKDIDGASDKNVVILDDNDVHANGEYRLNYETQEAELIKYRDASVKRFETPEYVVGKDGVKYKVTSIGEKAFADCFKLKTLTLSQFVKRVGYKALDGCLALRRINILGNEISIDEETLHYEGSNITIYMLKGAVECWKTLTQMVPPRRICMVDNIDEEKDDDVKCIIAIVKL